MFGFFKPAPLRHSFMAMGTVVTVTVAHGRRARAAEAASLISEIADELDAFGREWWAWGWGRLSQLNQQLAEGAVIDIPPQMQPLFARAWEIHRATGGLYEPRIAALVRLWGFDDIARIRSQPPSADEITSLLASLHAAPGYDGGLRYGPAPNTGWDFGGIAKGWIVDAMLAKLQTHGFPDATVDAGGNLAVRGRYGSKPWRIGLRDPDSDAYAPRLLATLDASDEAVNTHGDDQRYFVFEGRRYSHILHPATGEPVSGLRSLTVVHADGTLAEAGGAALYVAGREAWPALAQRLGITQVMAVTDDGVLQVTPALLPRLRPENGSRFEPIELP